MALADNITIGRILKYSPTAVLGLLILAWVFTQGGWMELTTGKCVIALQHGSVTGYWQKSDGMRFFWTSRREWWLKDFPHLGRLRAATPFGASGHWFPIPLLGTLILPLAVGPVLAFRFRLWHYLAYTALFALELAYYLRWQE